MPTSPVMRSTRFHGRHENQIRECQAPGCDEAGQFRAPGPRTAGFDGPGDSLWFCLDHVREFNAAYNWFAGMSADEIVAAQHPAAGWAPSSTTRAFGADGGAGGTPRWADFDDPLDAIGARASDLRRQASNRARASRFSREEQDALAVMDLPGDIDRTGLRRRYSELVRRLHPDRNGGDRRHEARLTSVVKAYQLLRKSAALA